MCGLPPVTEYPFPIDDPRFAVTHALPEYFGEMVGKSIEEIVLLMANRMSSIRSEGVARVRDAVLSKYRPHALAFHPESNRWFLQTLWAERQRFNDGLFVTEPLAPSSLDAYLEPYGFTELGAIREFYHHFHSLTGHPSAGGFYSPANWMHFAELGWYEESVGMDPDETWAQAIDIFSSWSADQILLKPDGETAWAVMELLGQAECIVPLKSSFEGLMGYLSTELREGGYPDYIW